MNFTERLSGVFFSPQKTAEMLAEKPIWVDALILLVAAVALVSYFSMPYQQADTLEMMRDNAKIRERMGEERFNNYLESLENPSAAGTVIRSFVMLPITLIFGFMIQSMILLGLGRLSSTEGKFMNVFSVFLHGRFIDVILGGGLRLLLVLTKKSYMDITLSPAILFPNMEVTSVPFMVLSQIDFFQIWAYGVIGLGLAYVFKIEVKKAVLISFLLWLIKSLLYVGMGILGRSFM